MFTRQTACQITINKLVRPLYPTAVGLFAILSAAANGPNAQGSERLHTLTGNPTFNTSDEIAKLTLSDGSPTLDSLPPGVGEMGSQEKSDRIATNSNRIYIAPDADKSAAGSSTDIDSKQRQEPGIVDSNVNPPAVTKDPVSACAPTDGTTCNHMDSVEE